MNVAKKGFQPNTKRTALNAPPSVNEPSQDKSAISKTRYEIKIPSASKAYGSPVLNISIKMYCILYYLFNLSLIDCGTSIPNLAIESSLIATSKPDASTLVEGT